MLFFDVSGSVFDRCVRHEPHAVQVTPEPDRSVRHIVRDDHVQVLVGELGARVVDRVAGLGGNPTRTRPPLRSPSPRGCRDCGSSSIARGASCFFTLSAETAAGLKSETAAVATTTSRILVLCMQPRSRISTAVVTRTVRTPNGSGSVVGPLTSVTSAPRRAASSAIA